MQHPTVPDVQNVKVSRVLNTGTSSAIVPFHNNPLHTVTTAHTHTHTSRMVRACPHTNSTDCTQKLTGTHKHHNHFSLVPICPVTTRKQIHIGLLDLCVCVCSNWGMREGYHVCVCTPDCCAVSGVNAQSGLIWQTNRPQGGWGIDVCLCVCLCVCLIEHGEEKRAQAQAGEVNSARPHCSLFLSDRWICTQRHSPNILADIAKKIVSNKYAEVIISFLIANFRSVRSLSRQTCV